MIVSVRAAIGAPLPWPWPFFAAGTGIAAPDFATAVPAGAADSLGAGGGQVTVPSLTTVVPRITSSSMLTLKTPSFALQSSSESRNRFVAYSVLACVGRRLGRSE